MINFARVATSRLLLPFLLVLAYLAHAQIPAFGPVSPSDIAASEERVHASITFLGQQAAAMFQEAGERYTSPRVIGFQVAINTGCGPMNANNAYACRADGTIYYDRAFIASIMVGAARTLHSDGDMAAVYPIAHEWGHALQYVLGLDYSKALSRAELDADCLAGVLIGRANARGKLKAGGMQEAEYAVALVGDTPLSTGVWGRAIERINMSAGPGSVPVITNAMGTHGNPRERLDAFRRGLANNMRVCTAGIPRPMQTATTTRIHWFVDDMATAYDRAVAENKPLVLVSGRANGTIFARLQNEVLESSELAQLANVAIFASSDPSRDLVARNVRKALGYDSSPVISLLAPNPNMLDEQSRIVGLFDAPSIVRELSKGMVKRGWMGPARAPWLLPLPPR